MAAGGATRTAEETHAALDREAEARYSDPRRWQVFGITWLCYASYYLTRKPFSTVKSDLTGPSIGLTKVELAMTDVAYLAMYAVGQFAWGWLADKLGPRLVLSAGMLATAACAALFGMSSTLLLFALLWALNGFAQATGWSSNVKAMTAWFPPLTRGRVMGFWATCYQIGGLFAGYGAVASIAIFGPMLAAHATWRGAFFGPAIAVAAVGLLVFAALPDVKTSRPGDDDHADRSQVRRAARSVVVRSPLVWALGSSYLFMKLIRYTLLFWLIFFMETELHYSKGKAVVIGFAFEGAGALGSILVGLVSDRWFRGKRLGVGITSLIVLACALPLYGLASYAGTGANFALLAVVGFFLFGPDTLLPATAAQDLGGAQAAATASGFINGVGSIGPVVGTFLAADLSTRLGWAGFYTVLGVGSLVSAAILVPFWWRQRRASEAVRTGS
jgi:sugar phosphate permease